MPLSRSPEPSDDARPAKKRRQRPQLSCTECRRLKMKCDRTFPCANCKRRELAHKCHRGGPGTQADTSGDATPQRNAAANMHDRLAYLESLLLSSNSNTSSGRDARHLESTGHSRDHGPELVPSQGQSRASPSPAPSLVRRISYDDFLDVMPTRTSGDPQGMPALTAAVDMVDQRHSGLGNGTIAPAAISADLLVQASPVAMPDPLRSSGLASGPPLQDESEDAEGVGTLVMFPSGRAKFLGRTAASEWLKNQEMQEAAESPPPMSRLQSPEPEGRLATEAWPSADMNPFEFKVAFPFNTATRSLSTASLLSQLPPISDGRTLVDVYFRHFSWHFNVVGEEKVLGIFDKAYGMGADRDARLPPDQLALLFIIFAMGAYYNLELPADDSSVEDYLKLSRCCLSKADFLSRNTIAGVQTLHIMGHLEMSMESGRNGDSAWPLWGLVVRLLQAMGLHRDGQRWGLPENVIEERRRVFWECYSTDIMSSNNFCRPGSISPQYMDTAYPTVATGDESLDLFHKTKFKMSPLFLETLDHSMNVHTPPYSNVAVVNEKISNFERNIPFELRSRPVLLTLPSLYPDPDAAIRASPVVNKRNLQRTFQQFTLAMNISECYIHLHRPYFARALYESPRDPTRSRFGPSYLAVVERSNAIVTIASSLYNLYPQAAARHWWIWYHAFSSAACMGTLVLKNPQNVLATFALTLVDTVIRIYTSVVKSRNSPRMIKNLNWLTSLRLRLDAKMAQTPEDGRGDDASVGEDDNDLELLGWKTRLIERAGQGHHRARTIHPSPSSERSPFNPVSQPTLSGAAGSVPTAQGGDSVPMAGEILLDQFWDSIAAQDGTLTIGDIGSVNWWAHGFGEPPTM